MKVICISDMGQKNIHVTPVIIGNEYTITGPCIGYEETHVHIAEHPLSKRGYPAGYNIELFAEINTDLDETELVTEEFNEKYCVPANK